MNQQKCEINIILVYPQTQILYNIIDYGLKINLTQGCKQSETNSVADSAYPLS